MDRNPEGSTGRLGSRAGDITLPILRVNKGKVIGYNVPRPSSLQDPAFTPTLDRNCEGNESCTCFPEGRGIIDMILVYSESQHKNEGDKREVYENKLREIGLVVKPLETEVKSDKKYIKVYIPDDLLNDFAKRLKLSPQEEKPIVINKMLTKDENNVQMYRQAAAKYFTPAQRSYVVWQIMMRTPYATKYSEGSTINQLLQDEVYIAAYPLHEQGCKVHPQRFAMKKYLEDNWAHIRHWRKKQPLWEIKLYFGDQIALYFAWLDFYTRMLIFPAIVGVGCFLYGIFAPRAVPSMEVCDEKGAGSTIICPLCPRGCDFSRLKDSCKFSMMSYWFDNTATVIFTAVMAVWATVFLEMWKRYNAELVWKWSLTAEQSQLPRPSYEKHVKRRMNKTTLRNEDYVPLTTKLWRKLTAVSVVLFMVCMVVAAAVGTIVYRISVLLVLYQGGDEYRQYAKFLTSATSALINLIVIQILTKIYKQVANWLTELENPRTEFEYYNSLSFKIFAFEFVNYYSSLIYIAFFKGRFHTYPGDSGAIVNPGSSLQIDICDPAGCLSELCIQLAIIMVGKQILNNIMEFMYPSFKRLIKKWRNRGNDDNGISDSDQISKEFHLEESGLASVLDNNLEMVIQYGFVTLFVAAFPLAPLFALLNNILEIRKDAYKSVQHLRRPIIERVNNIGAWFGVLEAITYISIASSAFLLAYTCDFIPQIVYRYAVSPDKSLKGYIQHSLSEFNVSDYGDISTKFEYETCYYKSYRYGPQHPQKYELSSYYWYLNGFRLVFLATFEHLVFSLIGILAYAIPDIPLHIKKEMHNEISERDDENFKKINLTSRANMTTMISDEL